MHPSSRKNRKSNRDVCRVSTVVSAFAVVLKIWNKQTRGKTENNMAFCEMARCALYWWRRRWRWRQSLIRPWMAVYSIDWCMICEPIQFLVRCLLLQYYCTVQYYFTTRSLYCIFIQRRRGQPIFLQCCIDWSIYPFIYLYPSIHPSIQEGSLGTLPHRYACFDLRTTIMDRNPR